MKKLKLKVFRNVSLYVMFIVITHSISGTHQINVGPREAIYLSEYKKFREFTTGLTLGYQYSLLTAEMFRLKFGADNSIDIFNGSTKDNDYKTSGVNVFVEPGAELLFYLLMPFTARIQVGVSDQFISSSVRVTDADMSGFRSTTNRFGMYFSPGLFFQTNKVHLGIFTRQRFHTGSTSYEVGNSDHSSKMFDWGFQGGFITGKISHTIVLESSRLVYKGSGSDVWSKWSDAVPERRFTYTIGINVPRVLKMEKPGEKKTSQLRTVDPAPKKSSVQPQEKQPVNQQDSPYASTPIPESAINLQGDIFKPRCVSECQSSSAVVDQCSKRIDDAWYDAVAAKSHYMASSTESNRNEYIKAIGVLKELCPNACK